MYSTKAKGVRYMEMAEGYVTSLALDENDEVIGYRICKTWKNAGRYSSWRNTK